MMDFGDKLLRKLTLYKNIETNVKAKWLLSHMALSNRWRFCYFRLPKCANSTVIRTIAYSDPFTRYDPSTDLNGKLAKRAYLNYFSTTRLTERILKEKYFSFTFVRNPYSRLLSCYLDKIASEKTAFKKIKNKIQTQAELSFSAFIDYLERGGIKENIHFASQSSLIPFNPTALDFIGRVENLEKDLAFVISKIFDETNPYLQVSLNAKNNSQNLLEKFYNDSLRERVFKLYSRDFDLFGYSP